MGYKKKNSIVKNTIEKANRHKYSRNCHSEYCFCNICKGILVDPKTKKSHMARRDTVVRNFVDVGGSSTTVIDLPEIPFPEIEFQDMEIPDNLIQLDTISSDNELIIFLYEEEYNFITKTQPKKGKKSRNQRKRNIPLPMKFTLGICANMIKYTTCEKCCKLYSIADVSTDKPNLSPKISYCTFQDFPNHPMANKRQPCTSPIAKKVPVTGGVIFKPTLIFLTISLNMTGSLSMHNGNNYQEFLSMSVNVEKKSGTGSEPFLGELLSPKEDRRNLPNKLLALLTQYYNNAYNYRFIALLKIHTASSSSILVLLNLTIYGRVRIL
ncbi:5495_t:CDS:2 [Gigaspora rosea]|nr:5495_t:CDS:2 [Gigaspora rosea]